MMSWLSCLLVMITKTSELKLKFIIFLPNWLAEKFVPLNIVALYILKILLTIKY